MVLQGLLNFQLHGVLAALAKTIHFKSERQEDRDLFLLVLRRHGGPLD